MVVWQERLRAGGIHLVISALVGLLAAGLVFWLWYPWPYRELSGGRELFLLVITVDVILGPLITLLIFDRRKPARELRRDLATVGLIQLAGLAYGLWTVAVARPVHLVFEIDRFRVVHAVDVPEELVGRQPPQLKVLPWTGPTPLAVRPFRSEQEKFDATMAALQGLPLSARPDLWQAYPDARDAVVQSARPLALLRQRFSTQARLIDDAARASGRDPARLAYLPVVGRKEAWTVLIDTGTAEVVGFVPVDSF